MPNVGFWRNTKTEVSDLPWPGEENWKQWKQCRSRFIKRLKLLEERARSKSYKGFSKCRVCKCINGTSDMMYKNYTWPSGYRHYIEEHDECPPFNFWKFVVTNTLKIPLNKSESEVYGQTKS